MDELERPLADWHRSLHSKLLEALCPSCAAGTVQYTGLSVEAASGIIDALLGLLVNMNSQLGAGTGLSGVGACRLKMTKLLIDKSSGCVDCREPIINVFLNFASGEFDAPLEDSATLFAGPMLLPVALDLCTHGLSDAFDSLGEPNQTSCPASRAVHWLDWAGTLLGRVLVHRIYFASSSWEQELFLLAMLRHNVVACLAQLFQTIFPMIERCRRWFPCQEPGCAHCSSSDRFVLMEKRTLVAVQSLLAAIASCSRGSADVTVVSMLLGASMAADYFASHGDTQIELLRTLCCVINDESHTGSPALEELTMPWPPKGRCPGHPTSFIFTAAFSMVRVDRKIKRFPIARISPVARSSHASPRRSLLTSGDFRDEPLEGLQEMQKQFWSPLLSPLSICIWFQVSGSFMKDGVCALCTIKNSFEELSVNLKCGVLVLSISVSTVCGDLTDIVGTDIEFDTLTGSGSLLANQWNCLHLVQSSAFDGSSTNVRAFLNGSSSSENNIILPPLDSFEGCGVSPLDPRMEYDVSFGMQSVKGSDEVNRLSSLEIASVTIIDKDLQASDISVLVAAGPAFKRIDFVSKDINVQRVHYVDMSVCPSSVWRSLVNANLTGNRKAAIDSFAGDAASHASSEKRNFVKSNLVSPPPEFLAGQKSGSASAPSSPGRALCVSIGPLENCRVILSVSNAWNLSREECDYVHSPAAFSRGVSRNGDLPAVCKSIPNLTACSNTFGCVLDTDRLIPTAISREGRTLLLKKHGEPCLSAVLDPVAVMACLGQLIRRAKSAKALQLTLKILASLLSTVSYYRLKLGDMCEISAILSAVREKAKADPNIVDSAVAVCLLGLAGCTMGCQLDESCSWDSFVIVDAGIFSEIISDLSLWHLIPLQVYESVLCAAKRALYSTVQTRICSFSSIKMQLQRSHLVRALLRALADPTSDLSIEIVGTVCTFLSHHFAPADRLNRTCASDDDFDALVTVFTDCTRKACLTSNGSEYGSHYAASTQCHVVDRCCLMSAALSALLLQISSEYVQRFRSFLNQRENKEFVSQILPPSSHSSAQGETRPLTRTGSLAFCQENSPFSGLHSNNSSESDLIERTGMMESSASVSEKPERPQNLLRSESHGDKLLLSADNISKNMRSLICSFPVRDVVAVLRLLTAEIERQSKQSYLHSALINTLLFLSTIHPMLSNHEDQLLAKLFLAAQAPVTLQSICTHSPSGRNCSEQLPFLSSKHFLPFILPNVDALPLFPTVNYFPDLTLAISFGCDTTDAAMCAGRFFEGIMDILIGSASAFKSSARMLCDGWSFDDVEPVYRYSTAVEPPEGFEAAFAEVTRASVALLDGNPDVCCCLGVASSQRLQYDSSEPGFNLDYIEVLVNIASSAVTNTSVASVVLCDKNQTYSTLKLRPDRKCLGSRVLTYADFLEEAPLAMLTSAVHTSTSLCVSVLCILTALWSRCPAFQRALVSEPGLTNLKLLIAGVVRIFFGASQARLVEILVLDAAKRDSVRELPPDLSVSIEVLSESNLFKDFLQTYRELDDKSALFSNLLLYRSGGSVIGRLCLQLLTSFGDLFFLSKLPSNWIPPNVSEAGTSTARSYSSLRAIYGEPGKTFLEVFEACLLINADVPKKIKSQNQNSDPGLLQFRKVPSALVIPFSLLLNSAVRRRIVAISSLRLTAWSNVASTGISSDSIYKRLSDFNDDWNKAVQYMHTLSSFSFSIISLETELARRMSGPEINFDSRVLSPINSLLSALRSLRALRSFQVEAWLQPGSASPENIAEAIHAVEATGVSTVASSMTGLFRKKFANDSGNDARSIGGMMGGMGKLIKKGIRNISSVSDGLISLGGRSHIDSGQIATFDDVMASSIARLRQIFLYILEFHRRTPAVLIKIFPIFYSALDMVIADVLPNAVSPSSKTVSSGHDADTDVSFLASCCGVFFYILCNSSDAACLAMTALCWGELLRSEERLAKSMRELLVVHVVSPNDSSTRMKINFWNFGAIGFSRLSKISAEFSEKQSVHQAVVLTSDTVLCVTEDVMTFISWLSTTPESLRDSFRIQLSNTAIYFVKSTKKACDNAIRMYVTNSSDESAKIGSTSAGKSTASDVRIENISQDLFTIEWKKKTDFFTALNHLHAKSSNHYLSPHLIFLTEAGRRAQSQLKSLRSISEFCFPPGCRNSVPWKSAATTDNVICDDCRTHLSDLPMMPWTWTAMKYMVDDCAIRIIPPELHVSLPIRSDVSQCCRHCQRDAVIGLQMPSALFTDVVAIGIILSNDYSGIDASGGFTMPSHDLVLSNPILCGEWSLDFTESHLRTRKRLRRSPLVILNVDSVPTNLGYDGSNHVLPPIEAERPSDLPVNFPLVSGDAMDVIDVDSKLIGESKAREHSSKDRIDIYNSPARSFTVDDWECLEAGSTLQYCSSANNLGCTIVDKDEFFLSGSVEDDVFTAAVEAEEMTLGRHSPSSLHSKGLVNINPYHSAEFDAPALLEADAEPLLEADTEPLLEADTEPLLEADTEPLLEAVAAEALQTPILCPGECMEQTFVCNFVVAMDYRTTKCILTGKKMYLFECQIDETGHLQYAKSAQQHSAPPCDQFMKSKDVCVRVPDARQLSSSLLSAIICMMHCEPAPSGGDDLMIPFRDIMGIHRRRYLLAHKGVEIFLVSGRSLFLSFPSVDIRNAFCNEVLKRCPHISALDICVSSEGNEDILSTTPLGMTPLAAYWYHRHNQLARSLMPGAGILSAPTAAVPLHVSSFQTATDRWVAGDMTNFEYIMTLNTYSGRTFNDWSQYPVFPWVLRDYSSAQLNLGDANVYRDLSKPMGALHEVREKEARKKFAVLEHQSQSGETDSLDLSGDRQAHTVTPFHFGTHYSSAATVLHYMVRLQPFASHAVAYQGGRRFDKPDRLFQSIERAWLSASGGLSMDPDTLTGNLQDVKELIPEFYYLPEFLVNINGYSFGENSDGRTVSDVELPPWANNSPSEFIRIHREALESPLVTARLHKWIDLIFGCKQRGAKAIKACNTFHHLSYEGSIDVDSLTIQEERDSCLQQIRDFGQTPAQIFQSPHPPCKSAALKLKLNRRSTADNTAEQSNISHISTNTEPAAVEFSKDAESLRINKLADATAECLELRRAMEVSWPPDYQAVMFNSQDSSSNTIPLLGTIVASSICEEQPKSSEDRARGDQSSHQLETKRGSGTSALSRRTRVILCPEKSVFIPWYDVMAAGRSVSSTETEKGGGGVGVSYGIIAAWGFADCSFKLFFNDFREVEDKQRCATTRHELILSKNWNFIRSISVADVVLSCAACSVSGRILFTGHAYYPVIHKWRVYPVKGGKSALTGQTTSSSSILPFHVDCSVLPVDTIPCASHQGHIAHIAVSVCNSILVTACQGGNIVLWSMDTLQQTKILSPMQVQAPFNLRHGCSFGPATCISVETTTGYIYAALGGIIQVCDVNGSTIGYIANEESLANSVVTCLCPAHGIRYMNPSLDSDCKVLEAQSEASAILTVIVGYSCGTVVVWQALHCGSTPSNHISRKESHLIKSCARARMHDNRPIKSICVPRLHRGALVGKNGGCIDIIVGSCDGSIYVWELSV